MANSLVDSSDFSQPHATRARVLGSFVMPKDQGDTLASSEDAVRHSKSSESVVAAFSAEGFGSPPAGVAALVADYVNRSTRDIPLKTIANMTPGSGNLGVSAAAGVNIVLGSLTPVQREVMKAGGNPFNNADILNFSAKLGMGTHALLAKGESAFSTRGGNQFSELKGAKNGIGDTGTGAGSGYSWLTAANQNIPGFSQGQVASAANFLKGAGLSREDVNHDTRHMVHLKEHQKEIGELINMRRDIERRRANGEDVTEAESEYSEKRQEARGKVAPGKRKHFDQMRTIRAQDKKRVELDGDVKAAHEITQEELTTANSKLGVARKLEGAHQATLANTKANPNSVQSDEDVIAGLLKKDQPSRDVSPQKKQQAANNDRSATAAEKSHGKASGDTKLGKVDQAKPPQQRHAISQKSLNPTV